MEPLQIAENLKASFPEEVISIEEFKGQVSVAVKKERIFDIAMYLHDTPGLEFEYLRDLCGVDYLGKKEPRFEVAYHLYSFKHRHLLRLKAQVPDNDCRIRSVVPVWTGANWHERECFDLFGIVFDGHPDMRRILLPEDWEGHPLRKDYPVTGPAPEEEWNGFKEVLDKARSFGKYEWNR